MIKIYNLKYIKAYTNPRARGKTVLSENKVIIEGTLVSGVVLDSQRIEINK